MAVTAITKGITTIKWGSESVAGGGLATAIVDTWSFRRLNDRTKIPGNIGSTKATVNIPDGEEVSLNCIYDSAITWPVIGENITLTRPTGTAVKYEVIEIEDAGARKKEATINLKAERLYDITYA
jgi:hypothetical protein